jgi:alkylation response protein AidB-like acyl-CoA dehydrogenase
LIEKICTGSIHISLAYAEVDNGYDYLSPSTTLDSKFALNGTKTLVLNGSNAEKIIVTCTNDDTLNIVVLDANTPGVSINSFSTVDGQSCSEISFENVKLNKSNIIATGNDAANLLKETINLATLCICAEAVGCMESCYHKTLEYTKGREQFGQPISGFQVLQHRMVDMFIESELAKSLLIKAMLEVNNRSDEMYKHVSALKSYVGKSGKLSAKEAVQLHGGMGVSEEMMIGHYLKKMISIDALFGNADYHLKTFS